MGNGTIYHIRVAHELKKKYNSIKARFYGNDLFEINNTLICTEPTDINSTSKTNESHRLNSTQYKINDLYHKNITIYDKEILI